MGEMPIMVLRLFLPHQAMVGGQHHTLRRIVAHPVVMVISEMQGLEAGGVHPLGLMEAMAVVLHGTMGVVALLLLMCLPLRSSSAMRTVGILVTTRGFIYQICHQM